MKRTAEVKREDCDWLNKLPENLETLQGPGGWTWRENIGSVPCTESQGIGDELYEGLGWAENVWSVENGIRIDWERWLNELY